MFGTGKNGKSTVLNALLGEELLPSGSTTCTGNITEIGPLENAAGKEIVRLHRVGELEGTWEIHDLEPASSNGSRVRKEWVTDMSIDHIVVEHKHPIFRQNVKILDVPGCVPAYAEHAPFDMPAVAPAFKLTCLYAI